MADERIHILRDILLELHNGASPESVQERFDATFTGVSAIEISLMEHELMNSDSGVTFEDVMELCDVHANLFKNAVKGVEVEDTDHPGHPVRVFKDENLALRAALIRVRRLLSTYESVDDEEMLAEMRKGLVRQMGLVGQFNIHYQRKEELFFPIMERYGHDSPPKVMWGVDDQIRELYQKALGTVRSLPEASISIVKADFEAFATEFESMIFKEESILLMILLESFTQDDWIQIAEESDAYGYAIIRPSEKWVPERKSFVEKKSVEEASQSETVDGQVQQVIDTPEGQFTITFTPKEKEAVMDRNSQHAFGNGYLSVEQANLILNHLPMEITFVNKDDIFQYYNDNTPADEMIFKRTPSQVGRNVELCHPPKYLEKVKAIMQGLREGKKDKYEMWFKSESRGKFVHVTYAAVHDETGEFQGVLEYVQDIQPYREIDTDYYREIE
ncbi:DUF438 domain-containing protein [Streptococcus sp. oral taxon 431]|uniref:DUF438 domain-containing protein n=1 Tax=Streptococcus sp. oral taxon 431 TaxID=712633 RepID=UPI00200376F8|nr:DUF438 domain-containing protein [Streptococcus sp. oral taxon 431]